MQLIKGGSSHEIHQKRASRMEIWQAGFHEATIRDTADYLSRVRYIHVNPVAAGFVDRAEDWRWGSAGGQFTLDPIPQGLKPKESQAPNVGAKAPTP
jgi:hypothetical protein